MEKEHESQTSNKSSTIEIKVPRFSLQNSAYTPLLMILLIISSFLLGSLYTKVQYLEKVNSGNVSNQGQGANSQAASTSLTSAFASYAKKLNLDTKKFAACFSTSKYKNKIAQDTQLGDSLEIRGTPGFFVNGKFVGGAYPFATFKEIIDKELQGTSSNNYLDYSESLQQAYSADNPDRRSFNPVPKSVELGSAPTKGSANAQVTIVEFSDFQCPFCKRVVPTLQQISQTYKDKVKLVYKHLPLTAIHPNAQKAAEAAECANEQGKFWQYHDTLFENQAAWSNLPQT